MIGSSGAVIYSRHSQANAVLTSRSAPSISAATHMAPGVSTLSCTPTNRCLANGSRARLMTVAGLAGCPATLQAHDHYRSERHARRPRPAGLHCQCTGSEMVGRHQLHAHMGRLALPGGHPRCLQSPRRRLGNGRPPAHRTGDIRASDGARVAATRIWAHYHTDRGGQYTSSTYSDQRTGDLPLNVGAALKLPTGKDTSPRASCPKRAIRLTRCTSMARRPNPLLDREHR